MKKVGILLLALIIALGALGAGYAKWSDNVVINGSVNSGTLCMEWYNWNNPDPCGTTFSPDPRYLVDENGRRVPNAKWDKDVACTTVDYAKNTDGSTNYKKLIVTIQNAYPGYYNDLEMEYSNCGTIPIKIQSFNIHPNDFTIDTTPDWVNADHDGQIWIDWSTTGIGNQIHPGQRGTSSFIFLITQDAAQGATYTFTIEIEGVQWNEYQSRT